MGARIDEVNELDTLRRKARAYDRLMKMLKESENDCGGGE